MLNSVHSILQAHFLSGDGVPSSPQHQQGRQETSFPKRDARNPNLGDSSLQGVGTGCEKMVFSRQLVLQPLMRLLHAGG